MLVRPESVLLQTAVELLRRHHGDRWSGCPVHGFERCTASAIASQVIEAAGIDPRLFLVPAVGVARLHDAAV